MSIFQNNFPRFNLGGVELRELRASDAEDYYNYMTTTEVKEFLTYDNIPSTMNAAIEDMRYWGGLFLSRRSIYWGIVLSETDRLIGTVGFNSWNMYHKRAEVSYDLSPMCWGHGIMSRALGQVVSFAYDYMNITRIQATVVTTNSRSIKLLERLGFQKEGLLQKYEIVGGEHMDYYLYAKVK